MSKEKIFTMNYSTIYHISSKNHLHVDCLQDGFVVCTNKVILLKIEVIPTIPVPMIPVDCCKKKPSIINFTTDYMTSKFEFFSEKKMNKLYINESMRTN